MSNFNQSAVKPEGPGPDAPALQHMAKRMAKYEYEELTRLAETRLAQNTLNYL